MWDRIIRKKLPHKKEDRLWYFADSEKWDVRGSGNKTEISWLVITER